MCRKSENELRNNAIAAGKKDGSQRARDRRGARSNLIYSMERGGGTMRSDGLGFEVSVPPV